MTKKQQRQAKIARQQEILNVAKEAKRDLTAQENAEFEALQREIDTLAREIEAEESIPPETGSSVTGGQTEERTIAAERSRIAEITSMCRDFNMDSQGYIDKGNSVEEVRTAIIKNLRQTGAPVGVSVTKDEADKFRACATDALMMRAGVEVKTPTEGARELRSMSLRDLAIECMMREGRNAGELLRMSGDDMYVTLSRDFYNPTAAFPAILDSTIKKSIVQLYNQVPTTFQAWCAKGSLKDFKETADHEYVIGGTGDFLKVPENGELKADKPSTQLLPSRKLDTYGRQFSMSRQAFINDDIGFLTEIPGLYAARAKKTIDKQVYSLIYNNGKVYDGKVLFHADHKNLITDGAKPSQVSLQEIILLMQKQTDPFGESIYMTPEHIIVPVGYEFELAVLFKSAQVTGSSNNDINPLYNYPINVVQTPVLNSLAGNNAAPWFLVANKLSAKSIQVDYLNGQEVPTIRRMEAAGTLGFTWDIYLDWGIAVRDYRGIAKNPGAIIA